MRTIELILAAACVACAGAPPAQPVTVDVAPATGMVGAPAAELTASSHSVAATSEEAPSTFSKEDILSLIGEGGVKAGEPWSTATVRLTKLLGAPTFVVGSSGGSPAEDSSFWVTRFDSPGEPISRHGFVTPGKGGNGCHRLMVVKSRQDDLVVRTAYAFVDEGELLATPDGPVNGCTGVQRSRP